jgi:CelD/BcsL family acetyltransferase involved in cellulose biosynthesis
MGKFRLELLDSFAAAEPLWRGIEVAQPLSTPYQRFEWISHWFGKIGLPSGMSPLVAAGIDGDGAPLFIMPLVLEHRHGSTIARFCGGGHSNLNMAIWQRDFAANLTEFRVIALLHDVARARAIDLFALLGQPPLWEGVHNPFAALPRRLSPDDVHGDALAADGSPFVPRLPHIMRKKARKLSKLNGYRYFMAATPHDVDRVLAAFRMQKAARFAQQGIHNVFDDPGVMDFVHAASRDGLSEGHPVIELHALEAGGEILAVAGAVAENRRFSVMFNSITDNDHARLSPGIILMADIIASCQRRGATSFDLGAGHASYKDYFCSRAEQRFDCFIPFSARGRLLGAAYEASDVLCRSLKTSPALMNALRTIRRWSRGRID